MAEMYSLAVLFKCLVSFPGLLLFNYFRFAIFFFLFPYSLQRCKRRVSALHLRLRTSINILRRRCWKNCVVRDAMFAGTLRVSRNGTTIGTH